MNGLKHAGRGPREWSAVARLFLAVPGVALLHLCLGPPSAYADGRTGTNTEEVDRSIVENCFTSNAYDPNEPPARNAPVCVGTAAARCEVTPPRHQTTLDIAECRSAEAALWNEIVEAQYREWIRNFEKEDSQRAGPGWISVEGALRQSQEAWQGFRDADCHLLYVVHQRGSIRNPASAVCMLNATAKRAFQLRDLGRIAG